MDYKNVSAVLLFGNRYFKEGRARNRKGPFRLRQ
jgi:hypothetical protein